MCSGWRRDVNTQVTWIESPLFSGSEGARLAVCVLTLGVHNGGELLPAATWGRGQAACVFMLSMPPQSQSLEG